MIDDKRSKFDKQFKLQVSDYFTNQLKIVNAAIQNSNINSLQNNVINAIDIDTSNLTKLFNKNYNDIVKFFGIDTYRNINNRKEYSTFIIDDNIKNYINKATAYKITKISDNSKKAIRNIIIDGINNNDSIDNIAKNIKEVYGIWANSRAKTIARTEVASISNYAMLQGAKQVGATKKKWIFNDDLKVRRSHRQMGNHKVIGIDELFTVENSNMLYPGDFNGSAEQVINCRCYLKFE